MTHDEIDNAIAVMQAYKEGKTIEYKPIMPRTESDGEWESTIEPLFNFDEYEYRIKPEPHYRPFKNAEEVMEAIKEHGSWFKVKESGDMYQVVGLVNMVLILGQDGISNYKEAFNIFTWSDGTPFGVKED